METRGTILVAPLHWGLGHATRCIPIIRALLKRGFKVIVASDGGAFLLLRKEFPELEAVELPSYNISYAKHPSFFKWKLLWRIPHMLRTIASEKRIVQKLVSEEKITGIISDNRPGVFSKKIPSVYITHQLRVFSGTTTNFSTKAHRLLIKKFDACWVPDVIQPPTLSGKLGHLKDNPFQPTYIGILSRMQAHPLPKNFDILAILSGPEPQRSIFEEKVREALNGKACKVLLVQGMLSDIQKIEVTQNITTANYMDTAQLEKAINESELVLSRSGYTTIMDLAALGKKAYFVPTPGQYEQEYLAKRLKNLGMVPSCKQKKFSFEKLGQVPYYKGLQQFGAPPDFDKLFRLFQSE